MRLPRFSFSLSCCGVSLMYLAPLLFVVRGSRRLVFSLSRTGRKQKWEATSIKRSCGVAYHMTLSGSSGWGFMALRISFSSIVKRVGFRRFGVATFRKNGKGGTASLHSRTCAKRNAVFGARFKGLTLYFFIKEGI